MLSVLTLEDWDALELVEVDVVDEEALELVEDDVVCSDDEDEDGARTGRGGR